MSRDLEEFLRMAAARRRMARQQGGRPAEPPIIEAEVIEEVQVISPLKSTIKPRVSTQQIADHAEHLGHRVGAASQQAEERIHEKFDHDVGRFDQSQQRFSESQPQGSKKSVAGGNLAQLFANPENLRQAIIMREILERPNFD